MRTILLLRHAKSSWKQIGLADHERPLNKRGQRDAPRMGELLVELDLIPDWICCSTARRTRQTAQAVAAACGYAGEIEYSDDLYHAGVDEFLQVLNRVPQECTRILLIGHNPGLEELLDWLTDESDWLPTAALVHIEMPIEHWHELQLDTQGRLLGLWRPKELS